MANVTESVVDIDNDIEIGPQLDEKRMREQNRAGEGPIMSEHQGLRREGLPGEGKRIVENGPPRIRNPFQALEPNIGKAQVLECAIKFGFVL